MTTTIGWTDETWNPLLGCSKVSPGCDNCYAIRTAEWLHNMGSKDYVDPLTVRTDAGPEWTGEVRFVRDRLERPLRWRKPRRIFVNSLSDMFHPRVDYGTVVDIFAVMAVAQHHSFQVLTKRPKRMASIVGDTDGAPLRLPSRPGARADFQHAVTVAAEALLTGRYPDWEWPGWPLPNVWLGTSIESDRYTFRADHLRATPAAVRFVSAEPLLGPLPSLDLTDLDWLIVGGESGPGARPMHPDWARDLRHRCVEGYECPECEAGYLAGLNPCSRCDGNDTVPVAFYFKQWGAWRPRWDHERDDMPGMTTVDGERMFRESRKTYAGFDVLDGRRWHQYPTTEGANP